MPANKKTVSVKLGTPIIRDDKEIDTIILRKPKAGELRGLQLSLVQMQDIDAMLQLIPRISDLTERELHNLEVEDFTNLSVETLGFFVKLDSPIK